MRRVPDRLRCGSTESISMASAPQKVVSAGAAAENVYDAAGEQSNIVRRRLEVHANQTQINYCFERIYWKYTISDTSDILRLLLELVFLYGYLTTQQLLKREREHATSVIICTWLETNDDMGAGATTPLHLFVCANLYCRYSFYQWSCCHWWENVNETGHIWSIFIGARVVDQFISKCIACYLYSALVKHAKHMFFFYFLKLNLF